MGAIGNLTNPSKTIITGKDSIVIKLYIDGYDGGRTLDVTGYTQPLIQAGHVAIKETATDTFKPMPLTADGKGYADLPEGHEYVGIVVNTMPKERPFVGIMDNGTVNHKAAPYDMTAILAEVKTACPQLTFRGD